MRARTGSFARLATPVRVWVQRFAFLFLLAVSGALIIMSQAKFSAADRIRTHVVDAFAPILETLSQPVDSISGWIGTARELVAVQEENVRLRAEVADLQRSAGESARLTAENQSLRTLIKAIPTIAGNHITARVIGDAGGTFVHSLLLNAGLNDGVRKGLAVVNAEGLVGRVTGAGGRSARVLLVIDLNSRIPVVVQSTRDRAILAGDNTDQPRIVHLPAGAPVTPGDRIVTSGHGGVFPPGIAVGVVASVDEDGVRVRPYVNWHRLEFVRVVDYSPRGIIEQLPAQAAGMDGAP